MNYEKRKSAEINSRKIDDDTVVVERSSTAGGTSGGGGGVGGGGPDKIELLQVQVANIDQSSDQSNTTINDVDVDSSDTQSMRIILPVFIENEQKYAQLDQRRRKTHSSPAKTVRRFSQEAAPHESQKRQQQHHHQHHHHHHQQPSLPTQQKKVSPILKRNSFT